MPSKKPTKKQLEIEKLKQEYFNKDDKLESFLIYDKHDKLIHELKYVPALTKTYKVYYENDKGEVITKEAYENLSNKEQKIAIEVDKDLSSIYMEALEYQRVDKDTSSIIVEYH